MADQVPHSPTQQEMNAHVHDYDRFLVMMKWTTIVAFIIGFIVVFFVL